jgi:hypothetical protein
MMAGMVRVLPEMAAEPPSGYVAFVERHLDPLRREAELAAADPLDAERLYTDVLTDVAARWPWLELARTRFGRPDAADQYLQRAFGRRVERPESEPDRSLTFEVWDSVGSLPSGRPLYTSAAARLARQAPSLFRVAIGPLVEAAVAWQHAYAAARRRRLAMRFALGLLAVVLLVRLRMNIAPGG